MHCAGDGKGTDGKSDCDRCEGKGWFALTECPSKYVGKLADSINCAGWALKGNWPEAGGLLDQSNWFIELTTALSNDQNKIDQERWDAIKQR